MKGEEEEAEDEEMVIVCVVSTPAVIERRAPELPLNLT